MKGLHTYTIVATLLLSAIACDSKPADGEAKPADGEAKPAVGEAKPEAVAPNSVAPTAAAPAKPGDKPVDISSAKADAESWMSLSVAEHGFEARFPVAPKKQDMSVPTPVGTIPAMTYMAEQGNEAVGVTVLTIPEAMLGQFNVDGGLDGARDGMINNVGGTIVSEQQLDFHGHQARAIVARIPAPDAPMKLEARLFWASPRMYQLISVSVEGAASDPAAKFFENFRLLAGP